MPGWWFFFSFFFLRLTSSSSSSAPGCVGIQKKRNKAKITDWRRWRVTHTRIAFYGRAQCPFKSASCITCCFTYTRTKCNKINMTTIRTATCKFVLFTLNNFISVRRIYFNIIAFIIFVPFLVWFKMSVYLIYSMLQF